MNKKKAFIYLFLFSFVIFIGSSLSSIYYFQQRITKVEAKQLAKILTDQSSRDVAIGDYRRVYETVVKHKIGNLTIEDFDVIENNKRILFPTLPFECSGNKMNFFFYCTQDLNALVTKSVYTAPSVKNFLY